MIDNSVINVESIQTYVCSVEVLQDTHGSLKTFLILCLNGKGTGNSIIFEFNNLYTECWNRDKHVM